MGFWSSLLKIGMKTARGTGHAIGATARTAGSAALHPQRTLVGAGQAVKTAAVGGAVGYVGWEKLTTDKSVARIVSDAVIGKEATDTIAGTADDVRELKDKAGEAVDAVNTASENVGGLTSGIGNFFRSMTGGTGGDMFTNFFSNIGKGNVSGLSIMGLVAAAFMVFGRFGWMSKIAGALLGMMIIGNNAQIAKNNTAVASAGGFAQKPEQAQAEDQNVSKGIRR
jgi:hypothetical protein